MTIHRNAFPGATIAFVLAACALRSASDSVPPLGPRGANRALAIAYYPTYHKLALQLDVREVFDAPQNVRTTALVLGERGAEIAGVTLDGDAVQSATLTLPDLPDGSYRVLASAESADGLVRRFQKRFERRKFPWEGNGLGRSRKIYPPFEPLRTSGRAVDLVLRRYTMNGLGLWESVIAEGHELLSSPATVGFSTAAGPGAWRERSARFTSVEPDRVVFEAENDGGVLILRTRSTIDFDGCMRVELDLRAGEGAGDLESLWVDLPLRDAEAPLWHLVRAGNTRFNPAGDAPAGSGLVWASGTADNGSMLGTFFPYLWLGGEERGIAFFADNDRGWVGDDRDSALELRRESGSLRLRLRLIRAPVRLEEPIHLVFGLQASPTKPMPADWRSRRDLPFMAGSGAPWGMVSTFADKYPAGGDFSIADAFVATRRTGRIDEQFIDRWIAEKYSDVEPSLAANRRQEVERGFAFLAAVRDRPQVIYFDGSTQNLGSPEWSVFQDEWAPHPFRARDWRRPIRTLEQANNYRFLVNRTQTYQDFLLWHAREWMQRGFGLMFDNFHPGDCFDTVVCGAYRRPDGQLQPSAEIWAMRDHLRRLWTLEQELRPESPFPLFLMAHMTNALLLPVESFADITLDNEWTRLVGVAEFPHRPDLIRAEMLGRQVGAYPHALTALVGHPIWLAAHGDGADPADATRVERSEWGIRMVHEIVRSPSIFDTVRRRDRSRADRTLEPLVRRFGYGSDEVIVQNYWDTDPNGDGPRVALDGQVVKWIAIWNRGTGELLIVVVNWSADRASTGVHTEPPPGIQLTTHRNLETGEGWDGRTVTLEPGEVRLLLARR